MNYYQIKQFKGINEAIDETQITTEASTLINGTVRNGSLINTKQPLLVEASKTLPNIKNLMVYYNDSQQILLASTNNGIYRWNGTLWQSIHTGYANGDFDYVCNNVDSKDIIVWTNGIDPVEVFDNTTIRPLKKLGKNSDVLNNENRAPKGNFLTMHNERLVIADKQNLYFSTVTANNGFDIDDFTTPTDEENSNQHGAEIFLYSADGTEIKGLSVIFDDIIIFKEKKIYRIFGTSPSNYQKVELFNASGAIADKSIVSTPHGAYFVQRTGIFMYDGSNCAKISSKLNEIWKTLDQDAISKCVAYYWDDRYILSVQRLGSNKKDLIIELDTLTNEWTVREGINAESFVEFERELLFCSSDGNIYRYDRGSNAPMIWESGIFTIPEGVIDLDQLKIYLDGVGTIKFSVETEKKTKTKTVKFTGQTSKVIQMSSSGRMMKFKIEILSGNFSIKKFVAEYTIDAD